MDKLTRNKFDAYLASIASFNELDVETVRTSKFAATPSVQQRLETRIQESSSFLNQINIFPVDELKGDKLGLVVGSTIASRTDTNANDRQTQDPTDLDPNGYECKKTDFDTHLTYAKLDLWAKFSDFEKRIRDVIVRQQALDRIMIGFNGLSAAATTDRVANPLLQDVNIGWFQKMRAEAPARVLDEGGTPGQVQIGATGDYATLDACVYDAIQNLLDPWHRLSNELVVILGANLMADKYFPLINANQPPSEMISADMIISQKRIGQRPGVQVPFVPDDALMITTLKNLSIYYQNGKRRRTIVDNAKRDRIENYESSNDAYVIEDYGLAALVENITIV